MERLKDLCLKELYATGGVDLGMQKMIKSAVAIGVGSVLTKGAKTGDYESVTETAKKFVQAVKEQEQNYNIGGLLI